MTLLKEAKLIKGFSDSACINDANNISQLKCSRVILVAYVSSLPQSWLAHCFWIWSVLREMFWGWCQPRLCSEFNILQALSVSKIQILKWIRNCLKFYENLLKVQIKLINKIWKFEWSEDQINNCYNFQAFSMILSWVCLKYSWLNILISFNFSRTTFRSWTQIHERKCQINFIVKGKQALLSKFI